MYDRKCTTTIEPIRKTRYDTESLKWQKYSHGKYVPGIRRKIRKSSEKERQKRIEETGRKICKKEKDIHRKIEDDKHDKPLGKENNLLSSQSQKLVNINVLQEKAVVKQIGQQGSCWLIVERNNKGRNPC